jgi:hypothetical protein
MTPLPFVAGVIRVDLIHKFGEDANAGSRFFLGYTGTPTQAQMTQLASNVNTEWQSKLQTLAPGTVTLSEVVCTDLASGAGLVGVQLPSGSTGSRTGATLTGETALVANFKIGARYRGGKPRNYLPLGVAADLADPQTWTNAFLSSANTNVPNFYTGIAALSSQPTITGHVAVSYYLGGTWIQHQPSGAYKFHPTLRATPVVYPVVGYTVRVRPGSQRRRMLG